MHKEYEVLNDVKELRAKIANMNVSPEELDMELKKIEEKLEFQKKENTFGTAANFQKMIRSVSGVGISSDDREC